MKKTTTYKRPYIHPTVKSVEIDTEELLAESPWVNDGGMGSGYGNEETETDPSNPHDPFA